MSAPTHRRWRGIGGAVACAVGIALVATPPLVATALGVEAIATAFWLWAREADDAASQLPRWTWLRRPATGLWLAVAMRAAAGPAQHAVSDGGLPALMAWVVAVAIVWAGLELLAALPLARGYSDLTGPYPPASAFIPLVLPAAGFLLLWRQADHWAGISEVRQGALVLLLLTAFLAALRAFARRGWTASLRWLAVSQSALAAMLPAGGTTGATATLVLWVASFGSIAILLAGELTGAATRRGAGRTRLWRATAGLAVAAVAWPVLIATGAIGHSGARLAGYALGAVAVALSTWLVVARLEVAPERRLVDRRGLGGLLLAAGSAAVLTGTVSGLALAWWSGFEPPWAASLLALGPACAGALAAYSRKERHFPPLARLARRGADGVRPLASAAFVWFVRVERGLVAVLGRAGRLAASPVRDLHTGDAQEYLLFLVGVGVLILLLPLLR
jgi:hypothetical protein